jgi:GDP-L-fucose synthase
MNILITGGNGFIAKNLFEQLKCGYNVVSLGSKELNLLDSAKVFKYIKKNKFDVVIHTATYDAAPKHSKKDPNKVLENNLRMFFNIVRCKDYFGKLLYFGSGAEFDREHWKPKMTEDYFDKFVPQDQYGYSKYLMTKYTLLNSDIYNLRLFGVFGKYDDWRTRLISNINYNVKMNLSVRIEQNKHYDFLYIDDLVKIVKWFIDNKPQKSVYNVCTGKTIDFETIAKKIIKISGKKLDFKIEKGGIGKEYSGDNSLLLKELKGFEFTPIDYSLKYLYEN